MNTIQKYQETIDSLKILEQEPHVYLSEDIYEYVALDISPNFAYLAAGGLYSDNVVVWDISKQLQILVLGTESSEDIGQIRFSYDSSYLAICGSSKLIKIWETAHFEKLPIILRGHEDRIFRIQFFHHPYNFVLCSCSQDTTIKIWNIMNQQILQSIQCNNYPVHGISVNYKNDFILTSGVGINMWYVKYGRKILTLTVNYELYCIEFPQHTQIFYAASGQDDYVRIFMKNKIIRKIENKEHWKWLIEFNGNILAISSISSINFWDVSRGKLLKSIQNEFYTHPSFRFRFLDKKGGFVTAHKQMIKLWIQ